MVGASGVPRRIGRGVIAPVLVLCRYVVRCAERSIKTRGGLGGALAVSRRMKFSGRVKRKRGVETLGWSPTEFTFRRETLVYQWC
jgi:hypothetical protein